MLLEEAYINFKFIAESTKIRNSKIQHYISVKKLTKSKALNFYRALIVPRRIELRMLNLLRQNKISKWFSGIGQEAISVGSTLALAENDFILPMHRNLGVFTTRRVDFYRLFCQLMGKADGISQGRERSFHFGAPEYHIYGMISHLAAMLPVADGLALSAKLRDEERVALAFCGDGGSSEGDFHEALNLAAVWKLPVIFMIENNGYGLSTPTTEQYACQHLVDRAKGYGVEGFRIDGNDLIQVYRSIEQARSSALVGHPVLIEAETFRMRGHEEASGTAYVPNDLLAAWSQKDPIHRFENLLKQKGWADQRWFEQVEQETDALFTPALQQALVAKNPEYHAHEERNRTLVEPLAQFPKPKQTRNTSGSLRFIDAIQEGLQSAMETDESVIVMGQDIAEYGGVFKVTQGFLERFGPERVRNTPIIESGILGCALGLTYAGLNPVVEMQFADFISCGFNQIVNNIAKSRYRWSGGVGLTIRCPFGGGVGAGPFHSQCPEGWFMGESGLKIIAPATVADARNLLYSAIFDPNPVLFFEHKYLYRSLKQEIDERLEPEPLGKARIHRKGRHASIITYALGVHWAEQEADFWVDQGIELEIIDLRSLAPIDMETVLESVSRTNRVLLLSEAAENLNPLSELSARLAEQAFDRLDAPIMRCAGENTPVPFAPNMEKAYSARARLRATIERLIRF